MNYSSVLREELKPALGCTDPIALAFTSAKATEVLGKEPERIIARCSGNMIKNAKSVIVPGTKDQKGIEISCVLGAIAGNASKNLEVLSGITENEVERAKKLVAEGICDVELVPGVANLYIQIEVASGNEKAQVTLEGDYTNITEVQKNGKVIFHEDFEEDNYGIVDFSFDKIYDFAKTCHLDEVKDVLDRQIENNLAIAKEGMRKEYGSNIGRLHLKEDGDIENKVVAYAVAGVDARMAGSEMAVVINSGSGNQGITVSVPIIIYAKEKKTDDEKLYRALIFANLLGLYQKQGIGRMSAYCGGVSAGSAAIAGIAFMKDEPKEILAEIIVNALAGNSGLICDGAKASCAMKVKSSLDNAIMAYRQAKSGNSFKDGDGVVKKDVDETIKTIGHIGKYGMKETDVVILNEMLGNEAYIEKYRK